MEEMPQNNEQLNEAVDEAKFSHSDAIVGVFTEPKNAFEKMSFYPAKTIDWLIPSLLLVIVAIFSNYLMFSDPEIKYAMIEKQMVKMEKNFQEMVDKGTIPQDAADEQLEAMREGMDKNMGGFSVMMIVGTFIAIFVKLFIVAGIFFLFARFALKGEGTYQSSLVALGLPAYITIIQVIIMVIIALTMKKLMEGLSITDFLGLEKGTYKGFLLSYVDPFTIWFYVAASIGYARLFKIKNMIAVYGTIFGPWIGFTLLLFVLAQYIPFLKFFGIGG